MRTRLSILVGLVMLLGGLPVFADESAATKIIRAMSAAPSNVSAGATVTDVDGTVLREGHNGWTCMPGIGPGDDHPMCNDAVWARLMAAAGTGADFRTDRIGISYMLQGDAHVNNDDPADTEQNDGEVWVQEGPHLMVVGPKEILEGVSSDPYNGGPYVMWGNTPYAHIMIPTTNDKLR